MVKKTTTTTTSSSPPPSAGISDDLVFIDDHQEDANEFSFWEFINQSDADSDTESLQSIENGFVSWCTLPAPPRPRSSNSDGEEIESQVVVDSGDAVGDANFIAMRVDDDDFGGGDEDESEDEDEEEEDGGGGYDLDDELVPWNVAGKFGRERMRKLGKRFSSKMVYAKHNRYTYVKPGCVRGKHGLGLKA